MRTKRVSSGEVELHVVEAGEVGRPPVLLVHGFPDCHEVYSEVIPDLARDFHVAAFDLRGVAKSSAPRQSSGYRIEAVLPDFNAVIDSVFGEGAAVHLVAHDWGSVLSFSYVASADGQARVRSFTSVSGPHVALLWDATLRNVGSLEPRRAVAGLRQLLSS
ncbi:MAG: alpha/beta fold hydrolase, partial [Polyangiaceae bacterium]|nr:alpha/beta fold hydrolase [Polyangiaceae bacterium]